MDQRTSDDHDRGDEDDGDERREFVRRLATHGTFALERAVEDGLRTLLRCAKAA